ncbi:Inhibitor of apoptosis-promoting Bax1-related protein [Coemansia pectinata]|uniref:Inhibitor of apoptosis-promoting Bax1-related protein n=1 Tax=Coemansia pectinata TaxID=1052879 RepID=A0A9W8L9F5_9FUNG|nr:Inhibitor of apoptosis-promoting Bax1-related protein [Coemansia pectinata]
MDVSSVFKAFSQTAHLKPQVQRQLSAIYLTLLSTLGICLSGYYLAYRFPILNDYFIPLVLAMVATTIAIFFIPPTLGNLSKRRTLLWTNGLLMGMLIQPAILPIMYSRDADLVYMAVGLATALFASFSVATMVSSKSQTVYAIGSATMALSALLGLRLLSWFYPSLALLSINLVVGIAISCLYVVVHTHEVLELAQRGERLDPVTHAMLFFSDFVGLFLRLLRLLSTERRRQEQNEREGRYSGSKHARRQFRPTESAFRTCKSEL